ncbi:MAG: hypothetical protein EOO13_00985 [Chitinophagaceae bacterium]|nr:MAG: hypothetical protein EOO13_00985 [Chitinophagaceae bacterium]
MKILATYSAANIVYGSVAANQTSGNNKYFHQMNAIWNGVTLGIVAIGQISTKTEGQLSWSESLKRQQKVEKLFLFNTALDAAYIVGGLYLKERSKTVNKNASRLKGYSQSIMLQGGMLLIFDGILYALHHRHGKQMDGLLQNIQLGSDGAGISLLLKF